MKLDCLPILPAVRQRTNFQLCLFIVIAIFVFVNRTEAENELPFYESDTVKNWAAPRTSPARIYFEDETDTEINTPKTNRNILENENLGFSPHISTDANLSNTEPRFLGGLFGKLFGKQNLYGTYSFPYPYGGYNYPYPIYPSPYLGYGNPYSSFIPPYATEFSHQGYYSQFIRPVPPFGVYGSQFGGISPFQSGYGGLPFDESRFNSIVRKEGS